MNIVILTENPFPDGPASTIRLTAYAHGMLAAGAGVNVLCTKATEPPGRNPRNREAQGVFEGIRFRYTAGTTIRPSSPFKRIFLYYSGFFKARKELQKIHEESKVDVLFTGLYNYWFTRSYYRWARKRGVLLVQERSEYPFIGVNGPLQKLKLRFYLRYTCRLFDVIVVITKALEAYFSKWIRGDARIYLLPMLVEADKFRHPVQKPEHLPDRYIAYVGNMQGEKDGVPVLIESFAKISAVYPDVHLVLIGDTEFEGFGRLESLVGKLGIADRVHFTGRLHLDELPGYLSGACCLALARPANKQAEGGFPNKLGEYLAAGRPAVLTSVGEIPGHLTDGENAFISLPGDPDAFAAKLSEVIGDPGRADKIGAQGSKLVETVFNPLVQAEKMLKFFNEIKKG